ncbi:MAG: phenylalanine--tRNA ligase subunit alpha [Candidatus Latescibacteria bacterium]|nr:phenylalanine--tRNA ligase subunit alpha [Candidatus Latescibacterota bacterium]
MENIDVLREGFEKEKESCASVEDVEALRLKYLGRKGLLAQLRKNVDFKVLSPEKRGTFGKEFNDLKTLMESSIEAQLTTLQERMVAKKLPSIDMTLPGSGHTLGSMHPVTLVRLELEEIFMSMGFVIETGFEVEKEYYNFDALNTPFDHPAREMQDTFWLTNGMVLRTQTSAVQVRALEKYGAPMKMIAPGRCFRYETIDASHENTFYQLEGLMVDHNISVANLISVMKLLLSKVFHREVVTRLRPGYFPFVEPGFELDIQCLICGGSGCRSCKNSGWIELLPCGLVHPNVLKFGGVDPDVWSGFAFGLGLTRLAMMKYGIPNIRLFNSGDIRALEQFTTAV